MDYSKVFEIDNLTKDDCERLHKEGKILVINNGIITVEDGE